MEDVRKTALLSPVGQRCLKLFRDPPYVMDVYNNGRLVKFTVPPLTEDNSTFHYYREAAEFSVYAGQDFLRHWSYNLGFDQNVKQNFLSEYHMSHHCGKATSYTKCTVATFTPTFYTKPVHEHFLLPGIVEYEFMKAGKTSLALCLRWFNGNGEKLATVDVMEVLVDFTTRKPTSLPQSFIDKYASARKQVQFDLREPDTIPEDAASLEAMVTKKQIDENNHMNLMEYVRFSEMAFRAFEKQQSQNRSLWQVKEMLVMYKQENALGDKLCLKYWQDGSDAAVVHVYCLNLTHQHTSSYAKFTLYQGASAHL